MGTLGVPLRAVLSHAVPDMTSQAIAFLSFILSKSATLPAFPAFWFSGSKFTVGEIIVFEVTAKRLGT